MTIESLRQPSQYDIRGGALRATTVTNRLSLALELIADRVAAHCGFYLPSFARGRLADLGGGHGPLYEAYRYHAFSVLEHVSPPQHLRCEIGRILADGRYALFNVPFLCWDYEAPHDHHRFTELSLSRYARKSVLVVIVLRQIAEVLAVLTDMTSKLVIRAPLISRLLAGPMQRAAVLAAQRFSVGGAPPESNRALPLGYFMVTRRKPREMSA